MDKHWNFWATVKHYPMDELPYDALKFILDNCREAVRPFNPTTVEQDLKLGRAHTIVYWYPQYLDTLYKYAADGLDWRSYLTDLHPDNLVFFSVIFKNTTTKLDSIIFNLLKQNKLGEITLTKEIKKLI